MNRWLIGLAGAGLALVFGFELKGFSGALVLGLTVVIIDYAVLRLRFHSLGKTGTVPNSAVVIGGFFARILNLVILLRVGAWWLIPAARSFFYGTVITIPVWNLLTAALGWPKRQRVRF
jgi:hypothetical protein